MGRASVQATGVATGRTAVRHRRKGRRPEDAVAKLDYLVLVIVSPDDDRVPPEHGVRVHEAAKDGSELWMVEDVEHCGAFTEHRDEYLDRVCTYFESQLF